MNQAYLAARRDARLYIKSVFKYFEITSPKQMYKHMSIESYDEATGCYAFPLIRGGYIDLESGEFLFQVFRIEVSSLFHDLEVVE